MARVTVEKGTAAGGFTAVLATETDDLGEYRVPGLPAGTFVVAAATRGVVPTQIRGNQTGKTYFPGVNTAADAGRSRFSREKIATESTCSSQPISRPRNPSAWPAAVEGR